MSTITFTTLAVVLVGQLGSPQFRERERATVRLRTLVPHVLPHLEVARKHKDPEISQRASWLIQGYYHSIADQLAESTLPADYPRHPWLDMLPQDHPCRGEIVAYYLTRAQKALGRKGPPDWADYRLATRMYIRQLYLQQNSPAQVRNLLNEMAEQERQWIGKNGSRYNPPLKLPQVAAGN